MAWPWSPESEKLKEEADKYRKLATDLTTWSDTLGTKLDGLQVTYDTAEEKVFIQESEYIGELNDKYFSTVRPHMLSVKNLMTEINDKNRDLRDKSDEAIEVANHYDQLSANALAEENRKKEEEEEKKKKK